MSIELLRRAFWSFLSTSAVASQVIRGKFSVYLLNYKLFPSIFNKFPKNIPKNPTKRTPNGQFPAIFSNFAVMNSFFQNGIKGIPPVTRNIIIICLLIWLVEIIFPSFGRTIVRHLGLHYIDSESFNPAQIITYMFVHDNRNPMHILFNMFSLWMFGPLLERIWGSKRFLLFYAICGVGAALVQEGVWALTWRHEYIQAIAAANGLTYDSMEQVVNSAVANHDLRFVEAMAQMKDAMVTIGASGAIFGLLLGFAFVFPNMPLYLFFIPIPIKAKYMVIGYAVLEFFLGVGASGSTVAHFAHLGGLLFGLIPLLIWKKNGTLHGGRF